MDGYHKLKWSLYLTFTAVFLFLSVSEVGPFLYLRKFAFSAPDTRIANKYVIVFDGGSTGTRIHIFNFIYNSTDEGLSLRNEYFEEIKPGLSNYADNPYKAATSVLHLLEKAKSFVPPHCWDRTPVTLKATAGLRLLPNSLSDSILESVSQALVSSPFSVKDNSVAVLDGEDEGIYAWYTLNFLLGRLMDANHSVVSLDLGGGSTQVTFIPIGLQTFMLSPKEYIIVKNIKNKVFPIYSHSYLGFGLMSARLSILRLSSENPVTEDETELSSSCVCLEESYLWRQDLKEYKIKGRKDRVYGFKECYQKSVEFIGSAFDKPVEIQTREIYALSYYFDRAEDLGLIGESGGQIKVKEFVDACQQSCTEGVPRNPFLCLDCSYISAIFLHALGLNEDKEIQLQQRINGVEASWGLGAAFNMLA